MRLCALIAARQNEALVPPGPEQARPLLLAATALSLLLLALLKLPGPFAGFAAIHGATRMLPLSLWQNITVFGDERALLALFLPFALHYRRLLWPLLLATLFGWLLSRGFKHLLHVPRPANVLTMAELPLAGARMGRDSFPSGHTMAAFTFIGLWLVLLPRRWVLPLLALASLVALSRIGLGDHWPADCLAGAFLGLLSAYLGIVASQRIAFCRRGRGTCGLVLVLLGLVLTLVLFKGGQAATQWLRFALVAGSLAGFGYSLLETSRRRLPEIS